MRISNLLLLVAVVVTGSVWAGPTWHVAGGGERFAAFVRALAGGAAVKTCADPRQVDFAKCGRGDVCFLLPPKGELSFDDWDVAGGERLRGAIDRGVGVYLECCVTPDFAQDGLHADLNGYQTVGRPRYLYQEYVLFGDELLQARDAYYLPGHARAGRAFARVCDCVGTHRESVKGTKSFPVLVEVRPNVRSAAMNLSAFDARFERPYGAWAKLFAKVFAPVTGRSEDEVEAAFRKTWPEEIRLSHGTDAAAAVRRALEWHVRSGVMPEADGSAGVFEMIRSNDLGVRRSYRGDTSLITAALFVDAGEKYGNAEWKRIGRTLAESAFARDIQDPRGYFRWYANGTSAYFSDCSRCARACLRLSRATGETRYRAAALRFAELVMDKTEGEHLFFGGPSGDVDLRTEQPLWGAAAHQDNPCLYGDMVAFLCETGEKRHMTRATEITDRIMATFPKVKPFGYSDNLTYSRCLVMLAAVQAATGRDYSAKINFILDFMRKLATPCGAIAESPLRLEACHTEGGVAMGDGSDRIADVLYCNSQVLSATTQLLGMPAERRGTVEMEKVRALNAGLRRFFLDAQIASDDPRLDGGWMRAFDTVAGEWYGLNKDMDWGAYCIMGGWVMGYVPMALMEEMGL